jgi:hypothetical protein
MFSSGVSPVLDQWYHLVMTYNSSTGEFATYVDGILDVSRTFSGLVATNNRMLCIGSGREGQSYFVDGMIDDVRVYHCVLSASNVADNYAGNIARSGLVSEWKLDGGSCEVAVDSVDGNPGSIHGALWSNYVLHSYTAADTYTVMLTVRDDGGATDMETKDLVVSTP